jgi:uncharacterized protein (DUF433 family)
MGDNHIQKRQAASGDTAYVGDSRVRVSEIARRYTMALDEIAAERIHEALPHLTKKQIRAALEYWRKNPQEIAQEIADEEEILKRLPTRI